MENEPLNPHYFKFVRTNKELTEAAKTNADILTSFADEYDAFRVHEVLLEYCKSNGLNEQETRRICETHERVEEVLLGDNLIEQTGSNELYYRLTEDGRKAKAIGRKKFLKGRKPFRDRHPYWHALIIAAMGAAISQCITLVAEIWQSRSESLKEYQLQQRLNGISDSIKNLQSAKAGSSVMLNTDFNPDSVSKGN